MSIVNQIQVTGANQKIQETPDPTLVKFIILNDSTWDAWVSFGFDPGPENYLNSDIHVTPTSYVSWDVRGNTPTIGNARWGRVITVYTTVPIGGSVAPNPSGSQIVISGFGANEQIPLIATLSRNVAIGNTVPLATSATSLANDGNASNTQIAEATVTGHGGSTVDLRNQGKLTLGDTTSPGNITLNGNATGSSSYIDQIDFSFGGVQIGSFGSTSGQLQLLANGEIVLKINGTTVLQLQAGGVSGGDVKSGRIIFDSAAHQILYRNAGGGSIILDASDDKNIKINAGNVGGGGKVFFQVGGVNVASIDATGNMILKGTLTQNGTP